MKKLKKIKLNIEKDIISSISKEDQIEIKGGYMESTRNCDWGGGATATDTCPPPTGDNCISPGTNSCNCGTNNCQSNNCYTNNYTDRCTPTGGAKSLDLGYNCYTFHTMCNC